jgi:hypothetical protein
MSVNVGRCTPPTHTPFGLGKPISTSAHVTPGLLHRAAHPSKGCRLTPLSAGLPDHYLRGEQKDPDATCTRLAFTNSVQPYALVTVP